MAFGALKGRYYILGSHGGINFMIFET
jgi:hypothetical protein